MLSIFQLSLQHGKTKDQNQQLKRIFWQRFGTNDAGRSGFGERLPAAERQKLRLRLLGRAKQQMHLSEDHRNLWRFPARKMGVSNSWLVYFMENPHLKWMIWIIISGNHDSGDDDAQPHHEARFFVQWNWKGLHGLFSELCSIFSCKSFQESHRAYVPACTAHWQ